MLDQKKTNVTGDGNKIVSGDDNSTTTNHFHYKKETKLSVLFRSLKEKFELNETVNNFSEDLARFKISRDIVGLEKKLEDANMAHHIVSFEFLKQEYYKKLTKYQFFEPAQEIHSFLLAVVYEKFRNLVYPMIRENASEKDILRAISTEIVEPILSIINEEGCDDIMGLSAIEIEGMIHYLTGQCHLKWTL
ncbi:MAG: hypothetical protein KDD94_03440 [Calditrichaeota bacterium]|nr:hypothetical protein [Calditrichota bacterium]